MCAAGVCGASPNATKELTMSATTPRLTRLVLGAAAPLVLVAAFAGQADASPASPARVKIPTVTVDEGSAARFAIPLSCRAASCRFRVSALPGSAVPGKDYTARSTVKSLKAGQTATVTFQVATIDDASCERTERLDVVVRTDIGRRHRTDKGQVRIDSAGDCDAPTAAPAVKAASTPAAAPAPAPAPAPAAAPTPGPSFAPTLTGDVGAPTTSGTDYGQDGRILTCRTPMWIGVLGQGGAAGFSNSGCTVRITCPTSAQVCSANATSDITTERFLGHRVTLNARMRVFSASGVEYWHRDVSCASSDLCAAKDLVNIRGGESASVECNGVRQNGPESNRAKVSCTLDVERAPGY
jgi:hypothetical protein